ncbi:BlaI/MecI/CopY family transcriptional regulator [Lacrimispora sp. NSJ-141]|uniref:BlaI/MecI/CopY family transcriptional regulator n=1 Tax=Lientehia hominis TaxID=2897778 RepID=A0AAP2RHD3_9FIRM|nr:BlaI/MecI/CopY family transcriptional regulator [Lientehia hominis]MCD2492182.1 BlaI/MecI/CopY family transcriptional regulator [Lientehia hominis]
MKRKSLTASEQELMKAVWEITEEGNLASTKSIRKKLDEWREEKTTSQVVYVQIGHLEQKGYVKIERNENDDRTYIPLVGKEEYVKQQARHWAKFWNKSATGYAMMALGNKLTKEEKEELRSYLDELD